MGVYTIDDTTLFPGDRAWMPIYNPSLLELPQMSKSPSAADMVSRFQAGIGAAGTKYSQGIAKVTENPMAQAAATVDSGQWLSAVSASAGLLSSKLKAVTLQAWQQAVASYGAARYTSSAAKAAANYAKVAPQLAQAAQAASQAAQAISHTDPLGRVRASINAFKSAFGKPTI